ncbi:DgyrCDS9103 [Dimorphilus gyrociliatus]|uniref:Flavin-containing monooxygenase n=1 Tax=Dimorphilus gyrociliatus TaxID=2664684 RepID=A0A7I8VXU3_9ANNE|nr:DgyrCDS9103 [Dimorphilus gyrociliatus]
MPSKRVCIIGAGAAGLTGIKACLEEDLEPVCFERTNSIGGLWNYSEKEVEDGQGCVMKSTVINTSKEMMCYSDYPIPGDFPNYMHNTKLMEYFHMYANHFDLKKHIKFHHEILSVKKSKSFEKDGKWNVKVKNLQADSETELIFDAVLLCTGHHAKRFSPKFKGQEKFKGKILHSHQYKHPRGYEDSKVVIVGIGNSGGDIAVELGRISKQVYLSTRRGTWVLNRVGTNGIPGDIEVTRRVFAQIQKYAPASMMNNIAENIVEKRLNHEAYGLRPKHRLFQQHPMVNDDLANRLICGSVIIKPDIEEIQENGLKFEDGTVVEADVIIMATGYTFGFPFLENGVINVENNKVNLFKYAFPPDLSHPTIAVIGCIQPLGAINPIAELQTRWAARVFNGSTKLPSKAAMWENIREKQAAMAKRYFNSQRHTIQVDWIPFMDEVAEQFGCKPNLKSLFLTDPYLAMNVFFGPCSPYQFRLFGPGKWKGARNAILTQMDRVKQATKTRKCHTESSNSLFLKLIILVVDMPCGIIVQKVLSHLKRDVVTQQVNFYIGSQNK